SHGGRDRFRRPGRAPFGPQGCRRRPWPGALAVRLGGVMPCDGRRSGRAADPQRSGAEAGRAHRPFLRAPVRSDRVARGAELAGVSEALRLESASVRLGDRRVLDDAALAVSGGEVVGLLGPNGAGKTTLVRAALGLARLASGRAALSGRDVATLNEEERSG